MHVPSIAITEKESRSVACTDSYRKTTKKSILSLLLQFKVAAIQDLNLCRSISVKANTLGSFLGLEPEAPNPKPWSSGTLSSALRRLLESFHQRGGCSDAHFQRHLEGMTVD